jgi:amidohydrolase
MRIIQTIAFLLLCPIVEARADAPPIIKAAVDREFSSLEKLYTWLHTHPELSYAEKETAKRVAAEWRAAGFEVTEGVGGNGIVGVLKNGSGATLLIRTDLDALPVKEQTGLPYASKAMGKDDAGNDVPVMHACGHDIHMTSLVGTARTLAGMKGQWRGTIILVGQPAEERTGGATRMIKEGLFTRFPKPDFCIALHCAADLPAGTVGYREGFLTANVDSLDIVVRGVGGHGAWPHKTKDPIVLAAQIVLALQTIVSREIDPTESAVVTVGAIQGGSKRNIISDRVTMQLTLRSYSEDVRKHLIDAIRRMCDGLGRAAGLPDDLLPVVTQVEDPAFAIYNDPPLTQRVAKVFKETFGTDKALPQKPVMGAEDFSEFGRTPERIPICMFWLGAVKRSTYEESMQKNKSLPSLHSPFFAPDPESTIKTGIMATTAAALEILGKEKK